MRYLSEIFWRHSLDVPTLVWNNLEFLVCLSVCQLAYFLTVIRQVKGYLQFWVRYLYEILWRHSQDVSTLVSNIFKFLVCLSVCQLAYLLTEIRHEQGYLQFFVTDLSDLFGNIPGILLHLFQIFPNFQYVRQSVCWLTSLLKGQSFGNLKEKKGLQYKPPGPVGQHYSPSATSPKISYAFALWAKAELYILGPSLTY